MIEIEIDGQKLSAEPDQTVIQVADAAGIYIPRFCYHKHLSIAANCRMCLVEVEKAPKPMPACATPVMPGMKVFTRSPKTVEAQRAVMEFLLINHPLDCPVCDQGGECELQDLAMGYGSPWSRYDECKRSVADENIGPLIETEMTRCIHCTRCVRFGDEVAGMEELGVINRGGSVEISTYVQETIKSEVSGNIIDLCPVGALTNKPYRFTARAWELVQAPSIAPHDCFGSNINVHTLEKKVKRVVARENPSINETWLSDRDRFSFAGLYHPERIDEPLVRVHGEWQVVEWHKALEIAAAGIHDVLNECGADKFGALASPSATLEEMYLLQKIMRAVGSPHIDIRLRDKDTRDQAEMSAFPGWSMPISELENADAILLIGSNLSKEQPLAALRVRKAVKKNAVVMAVNPVDYRFNFKVAAKQIIAPHQLVRALSDLVKALETKDVNHPLVQGLQSKNAVCIIVGALAMHHAQASVIRYLAQRIASLTNGKLNLMTDGANTAGGWLTGAIPHRYAGGEAINHTGMSAYEMLEKPRRGYLLLNVEPDLDCANAHQAVEAMKQAKFVVALSLYKNAVLHEHADVILPIAPFTETSGTYVNVAGAWQSFSGMASAYESSRPAWKILRALANFLQLEGFTYQSSEEVKQEVKEKVAKMSSRTMTFSEKTESGESVMLSRIGEIPIYATDSVVRHSIPLQEAQLLMEGETAAIRMHPDTARHWQLQDGDIAKVREASSEMEMPVIIDARIPKDAAWIAGGIVETSGLGDLFGAIEIKKA